MMISHLVLDTMLRVFLTSITPYSSGLRSARSNTRGEHCILCGFPLPSGSWQPTSCAILDCCHVLIIGAVCTRSSYYRQRQISCGSVLHVLYTEHHQFQLQLSVLGPCGLCGLCCALPSSSSSLASSRFCCRASVGSFS